jgi:fatty-acyl-CoA synthase
MPTLASLVSENAGRVPNREAVIAGDATLTWDAFDDAVGRAAGALSDAGIAHGDRVALLGASSAGYLQVLYGVLRLGAVIVPVNTRLAVPELAHVLEDAEPRLTIADPELIERALAAGVDAGALHALGTSTRCPDLLADAARAAPRPPPVVAESDNAMLIYTSGTTGAAKGVLHTHHSALWAGLSQVIAASLREGERYLHIAPLYHAGGLVYLTATTLLAGTHVLLDGFEPATVIDTAERHRVTCMLTVPAVLALLLRELSDDADLSSWTRAIVGGSPIPEPTLHALFDRLPAVRLSQMCGQTESGPAGLYSTHEQMVAQPWASGHQAEPFIEARVVGVDGQVIENGAGELQFRGETIMKGYWRRPAETAQVLSDGDGWLRTGDVVRVQSDGAFVVVDRLKDMIITGSRNVYSVEVERALATHPEVLECAVIGRPHPLWGESIVAVVTPRDRGPEPTLEGIREHCRSLIADYKLPHDLVLAEIPRNASGKVLKRKLRERYATPLETSR